MINNFDAQDIEQAIIGAILLDGEGALIKASETICAEDFMTPEYRDMFEAAYALSDEGANIDHLTVMALLEKKGKPIDKKICMAAMEAVPTTAGLYDYCLMLKEKNAQRRLYELSLQINEDLMTGKDSGEVTDAVLSELEAAKGKDTDAREAAYNSDLIALTKRLSSNEKVIVATGFKMLDKALGGGLVKGGLYILAARPAVGKTTVALAIAQNAAARGVPVLYFNMEMGADQIAARRVSRDAAVRYFKILNGDMDKEERARVVDAITRLNKSRFKLITGRPTTAQISAQIRRMKDKPELVVIDYIGLLSRQTGDTRSRYDVMSDFSAELKQIAVKFNIPIICLAQLNREAAKGAPEAFHLRDSGAMEQDADGVILLSNTETEGTGGKLGDYKGLLFKVAKNRHGKCGEIRMKMFPATGIIE
ncbi:MAG: AAA family ATPase [Synergistes sp.]|nr:AAA family ATPase [Clostridia bacterium]MBQ9881066.1 AAA family ATPase [Synergistes sp.]